MLTSARDVKITKRGRRVRPNIATPQQIPIRKLCQAMIALSKNVSLERSAGKREKTKQPNRYDGSRTDSALETTPKVANRVGVGRKMYLHAALPIPNRKSRRTRTRKRSRSEESSPSSVKVKTHGTEHPDGFSRRRSVL